ncbi:hypothetical protein ACLLS5_003643 [Salmonella enterica]|nr:hypothetical protein [Salmonella enterica]EFO9622563.1 hypothetical protein [Salmonella enterica]EFP4456966.1 hypothetical protein [Salmonella enterica]EFT2839749.1 hypothetical protein [Salmonella enterica]EFT6610548.1 hypothetical protein [Salmonella enterica]EGJ2357320.1 hypothetical protein [Salmonella enterica]
MQPLIKLSDANNGINFILDFIIDYLSLWQSHYPVQFKQQLHSCTFTFTLQLMEEKINWHHSEKKWIHPQAIDRVIKA